MKNILLKQLEVAEKKLKVLLGSTSVLTKEQILDRLKILDLELKTLKQDINKTKEK
jgi:hypothetical protein